MKKHKWQLLLGIGLIALSALLYSFHYLIFRDLHHIFLYIVGDIAFIPIDVLLVTLIIHKLLEEREKKTILKKLNMVIGTFFSEIGNELVVFCENCDDEIDAVRGRLIINNGFSNNDFKLLHKFLSKHQFTVNMDRVDLEALKEQLHHKREYLIRLLANPVLLEHESFTELLRAVFHLEEELSRRKDVSSLSHADMEHLQFDILRMYKPLIFEWIEYVRYLKKEYPYLFSYAMRTNPFDKSASIEIE